MYVISELVYNPQPAQVSMDYLSVTYTFPPNSLTRFHISNNPEQQQAGLSQLDSKLAWALIVLDANALAGGPNRDNQTEDENIAYAKEYLDRLETERRNQFLDHIGIEYIERLARDNQNPIRAGKEPVQPSNYTRQMQNFHAAMKERLRASEKYTPEIEAREATDRATKMVGLKYEDLGLPDLRKMAADRKFEKTVIRGGREAILAALRSTDEKSAKEAEPAGEILADLILPKNPKPSPQQE